MPKSKKPITYKRTRGHGGHPIPRLESSEGAEVKGVTGDNNEDRALRILEGTTNGQQ